MSNEKEAFEAWGRAGQYDSTELRYAKAAWSAALAWAATQQAPVGVVGCDTVLWKDGARPPENTLLFAHPAPAECAVPDCVTDAILDTPEPDRFVDCELFASDAASALTNRAAREIGRLRAKAERTRVQLVESQEREQTLRDALALLRCPEWAEKVQDEHAVEFDQFVAGVLRRSRQKGGA